MPLIRVLRLVIAWMAATLLAACNGGPAPDPGEALSPYPNRFAELTPYFEPQPRRENPAAIVVSPEGATAWVALQGSVDEPGDAVVELDLARRSVRRRYGVGASPTALALHPDGRHLAVATRFVPTVSIIDTHNGDVAFAAADYYIEGMAFSPDGRSLWTSNRWHDAVEHWDVVLAGGAPRLTLRARIPVATNPRDIELTPDGDTVLAASIGGLAVTAINTEQMLVSAVHGLGAPANGIAQVRGRLVVATTSASTHHPADEGPDTDGDGHPGDGTANVGFQDLQNEIAVLSLPALEPLVRYTSDTICCFDFRDVSPSDPTLGRFLPDEHLWIVGGAMPERVRAGEIAGEPVVWAVYSGSSEIQRFDVRDDGSLVPGAIVATDFHPVDLAWVPSRGELVVANRLAETVTIHDASTLERLATIVVGDVSGGAFPATDAEVGELFFFAGAAFSVDGDQTCNHCHRDRGNVGKAFSMPLLVDFRGSRMNPAARGMLETRPWFFEGAMDENNFFPVINEFARTENFCCSDYVEDPRCAADPPSECASRPEPLHFATRDAFFAARAQQVLGTTRSPGGVLPTRIDYLGLTRLLGLFLLHEPALLPNPNRRGPDARRGEQLFQSVLTACATCHPAPSFAVSFEHDPLGSGLHFGPVVSPTRDDAGVNLDRVLPGFLQTFPMAVQDDVDVRFGATTLLGLWDRAPGFLHDGRAPSLLEAIATPGHPALGAGQRGFNESDGIPDTHGGTSHLSPGDMADLLTFLLTL